MATRSGGTPIRTRKVKPGPDQAFTLPKGTSAAPIKNVPVKVKPKPKSKPKSKPTTKDIDVGITEQERKRWEEFKSRRDLTQEEQDEMARMAPKFMQEPQGRLYIKDFDKGWK